MYIIPIHPPRLTREESESALDYASQALSIARELENRAGIAWALQNIGWASIRLGDYQRAKDHLEESVALQRAAGWNATSAIQALGELAIRRGEYIFTRRYLEEAINLRKMVKHKWGVAAILGMLGWTAQLEGNPIEAKKWYVESLAIRSEVGDQGGIAWCLEKFAEIASNEGLLEIAVVLFGAAAALRATIHSAIDPADWADYDRAISEARQQLAPDCFEAAWKEGENTPLNRVVEMATGV